MPFIPTPAGISVEFRYLIAGQQTENCVHFRSEDSDPSLVLADLGVAMLNWAEGNYFALQSVDVELREIYLVDISSADGPTLTVAPETTVTGEVNEPAVANNVAFCLTLRTNKRGRSYRGRWYAGGFTRLAVNDSAISPSFAVSLRTSLTAMKTLAEGVGCTWSVLSKRANGAFRTSGVLTPITSVGWYDLTVDSQRRRLPGRGI